MLRFIEAAFDVDHSPGDGVAGGSSGWTEQMARKNCRNILHYARGLLKQNIGETSYSLCKEECGQEIVGLKALSLPLSLLLGYFNFIPAVSENCT